MTSCKVIANTMWTDISPSSVGKLAGSRGKYMLDVVMVVAIASLLGLSAYGAYRYFDVLWVKANRAFASRRPRRGVCSRCGRHCVEPETIEERFELKYYCQECYYRVC